MLHSAADRSLEMASTETFDVVLFGYRNDVSRARTLDFLRRAAAEDPNVFRVEGHTPLPQRLLVAAERDPAQTIVAELEELGAQVGLVPVTAPSVVVHADAPPRAGRPLTLVLLGLFVAAIVVWRWIVSPARPQHQLAARQRPAPMEQMHGRAGALERVAPLNADAVQLAAAGQFREAVDRLREARRAAPDDPVLTRNLQTVWFNWGLHDLSEDRLDDARAHLEEADRLGERVEVLRALGTTYLRQTDYAAATATLERALHIGPPDAPTLLALADSYLKQDKRAQALEVLQRAKDAGANGPEVERTLQQLSREVDTEWDFVERQSPHFRISFADDEDLSAVRLVLHTLEAAYEDVGRKFDHRPEGRTAVVLYTQQDFHNVTQTPDWAGAAFDGRIKIPVGGLSPDDASFPRLVRHEYAHSVIAQLSGGRCPVWLNEGLAVWSEEEEDGDRVAWAEGRLADRDLFPLATLRGSFASLPRERVEVAYAESYLAVRNLVDRYGARKLPDLLKALRGTGDLEAAFASVYSGNFADFQHDFQWRYGA